MGRSVEVNLSHLHKSHLALKKNMVQWEGEHQSDRFDGHIPHTFLKCTSCVQCIHQSCVLIITNYFHINHVPVI